MNQVWVFGLIISASLVSSARVLTWEEAVKQAATSNGELQSARETLRSLEEKEAAARGAFFPQVSASVSGSQSSSQSTISQTYTAQLSVEQNLFSGFADLSKWRQAQSNTVAARQALHILRARISADLKQAYQNLFYAQSYLKLSHEFLRRRQENLKNVELRFESGRENQGSVQLARAYLLQAQYESVQAEHQLEIAQTQMRQMIGADDEEPIQAIGAVAIVDPANAPTDLHERALRTPDYLQALAQEQAAKAEWESTKSTYYPSLDLTGNVGTSDTAFYPQKDKWSVGLALTLPLFSGGNDISTENAAQRRWLSASNTTQNLARQILVKLKQAYADYAESAIRLKVSDSFKIAAETRSLIARNKYNNGLMSFEDWDVVESDLIQRQKDYLSATRDRVSAEATWEKTQGTGVIP